MIQFAWGTFEPFSALKRPSHTAPLRNPAAMHIGGLPGDTIMKKRSAMLVICAGIFALSTTLVHAEGAGAAFAGGVLGIKKKPDETKTNNKTRNVGTSATNQKRVHVVGGRTNKGSVADDVVVCKKVLYEDSAKKPTWKQVCTRK